jgi:hypothetical protein
VADGSHATAVSNPGVVAESILDAVDAVAPKVPAAG